MFLQLKSAQVLRMPFLTLLKANDVRCVPPPRPLSVIDKRIDDSNADSRHRSGRPNGRPLRPHSFGQPHPHRSAPPGAYGMGQL